MRSRRPARFRSTSSLSGRLVITRNRMRPRFDVSDMNSLIRAITRDDVPPSLSLSEEPKARSPSSMITTTWPMARITVRIRSRFPSVAPTHFERKFFSLIVGSPHSFANASATKVLPVPIGPVNRSPIGTRNVRPWRMLSAMTRRSFFTSSIPPTTSNPCAGSTNSTRPKHSRSRISRLRLAISRSTSARAWSTRSTSMEAGTTAVGATRRLMASRSMPEVSAASLCARSAASGPDPSRVPMNRSRASASSSAAGGGATIDAIWIAFRPAVRSA